jgi:sortase B
MEHNENKKVIKKIVLILFIIIVLCLLTYLGINFLKKKQGIGEIKESEVIGKTEIITSEQKGVNLQEDIRALNLNYKDAKGWLMIPGTSIDFPIFQSKDNDRYLRNDRDNVTTKWGETFLDYRCDINKMNNMSHFIIYGHNTEVDSHFTPLLNYKNEKFMNEHKLIEFSTINGNYKWEVFSVYRTDVNFFYIDVSFANLNEYGEFLNTLKSKSMFDTKVNISSSDTILTLSTCDYTLKDGRFVVQAKLVK